MYFVHLHVYFVFLSFIRLFLNCSAVNLGLPRWLSGKESASVGDAGDASLTPGWRRSPGGGNGNPLQCSCLKCRMDRGAGQGAVRGVTGSDTTEGLSAAQHAEGIGTPHPRLSGRERRRV